MDVARSGRDAVALVEKQRPELVLMNVVLPGLNGIDAIGELLKRSPGTKVLVLDDAADGERIVQSVRAGASGFVVKDSDIEELPLAIRSVLHGDTYLSTAVHDQTDADRFVRRPRSPEDRVGYDLFTSREHRVLQLHLFLSERAIAEDLRISLKTVKALRADIWAKIRARHRADLTRFAGWHIAARPDVAHHPL